MSASLAANVLSGLHTFATMRLGTVAGFALFLAPLFTYRSVDRVVFGRWSVEFFALLASFSILFTLLAAAVKRSYDRRKERKERSWTPRDLLEIAVLLLACGYAWTVVRGGRADRLFDLNFFGSEFLNPALVQWLSLLMALAAFVVWVARQTERVKALGVVAASIVFALVLAEGALRVYILLTPYARTFGTFSTTAWQHRHVELNELGFRDAHHSLAAAPGARRLLVVGDSFAYGWGIVKPKARFGERLADLLGQGTGEVWEPLNASGPGTSTPRHREYLREMLPYEPDVIVLLYVFNDAEYLDAEVPARFQSNPQTRGRLDPAMILHRNSYLFQELTLRLRILYYSQQPAAAAFGRTGQRSVYFHSELLARHLEDLTDFVDTARQSGAIVGIVPFEIEIVRGGQVLERYDRFVSQAQEHGLPIWEVTSSFRGHGLADLALNRFDAHPNMLANQLAADGVAQRVVEEWLLAGESSSDDGARPASN